MENFSAFSETALAVEDAPDFDLEQAGEAEADRDANSFAISDASNAPLRSGCACCAHQDFDFGHNKGRPDATPQIIIDVFDREVADYSEYNSVADATVAGISANYGVNASFSSTGDDFTSDVNTTGEISLEMPSLVAEIEVAGDTDWFALDVVAGTAYTIDILAPGLTPENLMLSYYDEAGVLQETSDFGFIDIIAAQTGTVYVEAGFTGGLTGDYLLSAFDSSDGLIDQDDFTNDVNTTGEINLNGITTGEIEEALDADWFALDVVAGTSYTLEITSDGFPLTNTGLGHFNSAEQFLGGFLGGVPLVINAVTTETLYIEVIDFGANLGTYDLTVSTEEIAPDLTSDVNTTGELVIDGFVTGLIEVANDTDWFALDVVAGQSYTINIFSNTLLAGNLDLNFYDSTGILQGGVIASAPLTFTATTTGTVFVEADVFGTGTGSYQLTATTEAPTQPPVGTTDDFAADVTTTGVLLTDGTVSTGALNFVGDDDWFELTLDEAQTLQINLTGVSLSDPFLYVYDSSGTLVTANDDFGSLDSQLTFNFEADTYYISARAYDDGLTGTYELTAIEVEPPTLLSAIDWGTPLEGASNPGTLTINVFFLPTGTIEIETFGTTENTIAFNEYEIAQFNAAFDLIEAHIDVEFVEVDNAADADFRLGGFTDSTGLLGFMFTPDDGVDAGIGLFNRNGDGWDENGNGGLEVGGFGFETIVHELGHGLGLAHPHDNGGGSSLINGVSSSIDLGAFNLNQDVFTIESYNGYETGLSGDSAIQQGILDYGVQATFATLDLGVLAQTYGLNTTTGLGDTVYTLPGTNASGEAYFQTILDNGGTDTIQSSSADNVFINLNAATLEYEEGGGGFVSQVTGILGGFTIANGSVIENAISGSGNDDLFGNEANNTLIGGSGIDSLAGAAGNDILLGDNTASLSLTSYEGQLYRAYQAVFDRAPDEAGFKAFLTEMRLGNLGEDTANAPFTQQEAVITQFVNSQEFQNTYGSLTDVQFMEQLYLNVLDRPGSAADVAAFAATLAAGRSRADVVVEFANSAEFVNLMALPSAAFVTNVIIHPAEAQVFRIYQAVFQRDPDEGGFTAFTNAIQANVLTVEEITAEFVGSAEFQATYGALSNAEFVELLFTNVLPGNTDQQGRADFIEALGDGRLTREAMVAEFVESFEFVQRMADPAAEFVTDVFTSSSDTLDGGVGGDILFGGRGADVFVFDTEGGGADSILDFTSGTDILDLGDDASFDSFAEIVAAGTQVGLNTVFDFGGGNTLTLENTVLTDLTEDDFGLGDDVMAMSDAAVDVLI